MVVGTLEAVVVDLRVGRCGSLRVWTLLCAREVYLGLPGELKFWGSGFTGVCLLDHVWWSNVGLPGFCCMQNVWVLCLCGFVRLSYMWDAWLVLLRKASFVLFVMWSRLFVIN